MNKQFITPLEEPWQQETLVHIERVNLCECLMCGTITNQEYCTACRQELANLLVLRCPACGHRMEIKGKEV